MALIGGSGRRRAKLADAQPDKSSAVQVSPPNLRSELLSLELRYGRAALIAEFERFTAPPRGRRPLNDRKLLDPQFESDARALLEGKDPFALAPRAEIVNALSERSPGHSLESTKARLRKYLKENRASGVLLKVILARGHEYPHASYIAALRYRVPAEYEVSETTREVVALWADQAEATVSRYRDRLGEPPAAMSLGEIDAALKAWVPPPEPHSPAESPNATSALAALWRVGEGSRNPGDKGGGK
jgi:hypothetical protein